MVRNQNEEALWAAIVVLALLALGVGVWKFSNALGVDFATGIEVLIRLILAAGVYLGLVWLGIFQVSKTWQFNVAGVWFSLFPALKYWSMQRVGPFAFPESAAWYGTLYAQWGILVFLTVFGYLLKKYLER